ncbi:translation elongation factor Ts [Blattabacterium sp. (Cryptocercus kyebangensis)]|uniref:translation elongation factor Ts n=1 Tax=Blattabacterium sp. (Cryptocercus kyebangensis) TaxID=298656 RepID=UPI000D7D1994|nr:translation elongation factor Ts [Blattabacterium sp. (Cryptocercus kyebangensis)]AWU43668.1 translation elongation factor Ts [Blattabacterium sp. (Cryptocercus kyebangensis)]
MKISIFQIYKLRKITGIGIMDCKIALTKTNGNFEKAIDFLRKKGEKIAINRSSLEVKEGAILSSVNIDQTSGTIIGLSCETDFLSRSSDFLNFLSKLSEKSFLYNTKKDFLSSSYHGRSIREMIIEKISVFDEKLELKIFEKINSPFVVNYTHNNKIASLVGFSFEIKKSIAKNIAMHITAMNPIAINKKEIPEDLIKKELEIIRFQIEKEKKTDQIKEKMILGRMKKFILENTLFNQKYIKDNNITVQEYMNRSFSKNVKINSYKRISIS